MVHREPGAPTEFRCRVGHSFSLHSMFAEHFSAIEKAMWAAIVALEEGAVLAAKFAESAQPELKEKLLGESRQRKSEADELRRMLEARKVFSLD